MEKIVQCRSCPWRVDCDPLTDIPNGYSVELHEGLRDTIARPGCVNAMLAGQQRIMACHYSPVGEERPCAGWMHHQLGAGNNLWLRLEVIAGRMPPPLVEGEQRFEDTLP